MKKRVEKCNYSLLAVLKVSITEYKNVIAQRLIANEFMWLWLKKENLYLKGAGPGFSILYVPWCERLSIRTDLT